MQHLFEFVAVKKKKEGQDEPEVIRLLWKGDSNRRSKVVQCIYRDLVKSKAIENQGEVEELYLRQYY